MLQFPNRDNDLTAIVFARLTTGDNRIFEDIQAVGALDSDCQNPACIIQRAVCGAKSRVFRDALIHDVNPEDLYLMYAEDEFAGVEIVGDPEGGRTEH